MGAEIVDDARTVFERAEMMKVKEPLAVERAMLREGQVLFTCLHLAPDPEQVECLPAQGQQVVTRRGGTEHGCAVGNPITRAPNRIRSTADVRAWADNEPDNDHTNPPPTTQIGRLFLLSSGRAGTPLRACSRAGSSACARLRVPCRSSTSAQPAKVPGNTEDLTSQYR